MAIHGADRLTTHYAELPGVRLHFVDTGGDGETIALLHANTGTLAAWAPQIDAFASAGYRVIAFDRRGWGASLADPASGVQPATVADDLDALATHLGLPPFHLVGVAGGAFCGLDFAAWRPHRLRSLVAAASSAQLTEPEIEALRRRIEFAGFRDLPAHHRELSASYRGGDPFGVQRWIEIDHGSRQPGAPVQPLRTPNTYAKLAMIATPTLVIAGCADAVSPPSMMRLWAAHLPNAQFSMIAEAGHAISWEQPDAFNALVLEFVRRC